MIGKNYYDVTEWKAGNAYEDIGEVINSILADIKKRQVDSDVKDGGKPVFTLPALRILSGLRGWDSFTWSTELPFIMQMHCQYMIIS